MLILLSPFLLIGQSRRIDSLKALLKNSKQDTSRINALNGLSNALVNKNPDTALILSNEALILSQQLNFIRGEVWSEYRMANACEIKKDLAGSLKHYQNVISLCESSMASKTGIETQLAREFLSKTYGNLAGLYFSRADYQTSLDYYLKAQKVSEEGNSKLQLARALVGVANVHYCQADYPKALAYYFKGLKKYEEAEDKKAVAKTLVGIANVYSEESDYKKALEFLFRALKLFEEMGEKQAIGGSLGNIANAYLELEEYPKALQFYFKSLSIAEEAGDKEQIGRTIGNIALVYDHQSDYARAMEYYVKGLKLSESVGNRQQVSRTLGNIGHLYFKLGKYKEAELHLQKALVLSKEMGVSNVELLQHKYLTELYEKTNRPAKALEQYKMFIALRDTIFSQENSQKLMRTEMDHEYEKKKAVADAEHKAQMESQKLMAAEKEKKQNIVIVSVVAGLLLVIVFAGFIFRSLRITNKQKRIIEQKNLETEHQKKEIEEKQKEILDSIHYAKRIQMAQVPSEKRVKAMFNKARA